MSRLSKSIQTARPPVVTGGSSKISLWDDGNVLQTDYGDESQFYKYTKKPH